MADISNSRILWTPINSAKPKFGKLLKILQYLEYCCNSNYSLCNFGETVQTRLIRFVTDYIFSTANH